MTKPRRILMVSELEKWRDTTINYFRSINQADIDEL